MEKIIYNQVNKIQIGRFSVDGIGEKWIEDPVKINNIEELIKLMVEKAEMCPHFIDSPQLTRFKIKLYKNTELLQKISVAGHFIRCNNEWHWTGDSCLEAELVQCTEDLHLIKPKGCTFE